MPKQQQKKVREAWEAVKNAEPSSVPRWCRLDASTKQALVELGWTSAKWNASALVTRYGILQRFASQMLDEATAAADAAVMNFRR